MFVRDALKRKGTEVETSDLEKSIVDVARILKGKGIGVLVACDPSGRMCGIISERDIVHGIAMHGSRALEMSVRDLMTENVVICRRRHTAHQAMKEMIDHACRHLPVIRKANLNGLVSISDLVKLRIEELRGQVGDKVKSDQIFVSHVLETKGTEVVTTEPERSIVDACRVLKGKGIGALVVCDPAGQVVGIVSERDIVHGISMHGKRALEMRVRDLMTHDVITCERSYTVYQAYSVMVDHAFRHLPVVEDGNLKGLVSISDVVKLRLRDLERQIRESKLPAPEHL